MDSILPHISNISQSDSDANANIPQMNNLEVKDAEEQNDPGESDRPELPLHPLKRRWKYWYLNDQRNVSWEDRLKLVAEVKSVEEFWSLYSSIMRPSMLNSTCDYDFFKEDIQPMWEAKENIGGGRWLIKIDKNRHYDLLDLIWKELLIALIGEKFGPLTEQICGAVVNVRNKGSKISLWTSNGKDDESVMKIGEILKGVLINPDLRMGDPRPLVDVIRYEEHQEVQLKNSSSVRARHIIVFES